MDGISKMVPEKMPQPNKERVNKMANNQSTDKQICYLETGSTDPGYNLAFEEYILLNKKEDHYLLLWQNDKTVVVGQYQNTIREINQRFVEEHGIRVVRRATDLIAEGALAIKMGATLDDLIETIHSHPMVSEAVREAALDAEDRVLNMPPSGRG